MRKDFDPRAYPPPKIHIKTGKLATSCRAAFPGTKTSRNRQSSDIGSKPANNGYATTDEKLVQMTR